MHRNSANFLIAFCAMALTLGCFWSSERESGSSAAEPDDATSNAATADAPASNENKTVSMKRPDKGDFIVEHLEVKTPKYIEIDKQVQSEKLLTKAADKLNRALILPHDIPHMHVNA